MLVGSGSRGLAAVVARAEIDGPSSILLQALAVAVRHRGAGGEVAREAVSVAFGEIRERAERVGSTSIVVETRIDRRNRSSRRLAGAVGFIQDVDIEPDLERWLHVEDLAPPSRVLWSTSEAWRPPSATSHRASWRCEQPGRLPARERGLDRPWHLNAGRSAGRARRSVQASSSPAGRRPARTRRTQPVPLRGPVGMAGVLAGAGTFDVAEPEAEGRGAGPTGPRRRGGADGRCAGVAPGSRRLAHLGAVRSASRWHHHRAVQRPEQGRPPRCGSAVS